MTPTTTRAPRAPDDAVRLRMDPHPSRSTILDGGWWPRSRDVAAELPSLVKALPGTRGQITHVLLNTAEWDLPHNRTTDGAEPLRLGWYTSQPAGLVTLISEFGLDRFDLLVVPPGASGSTADTAMTAAAEASDRRHAPELLTGIGHTG